MRPSKVLLVEDYPEVRAVFRNLLEQEGFRVAVAADAVSMRDTLNAGDIDVVVIDVGLPGGTNGLALANEATAAGLPVIVVTGHPTYFEAVEKSGHPYLFKPFRMEALLQTVHQILREVDDQCAAGRR